MKSPIISIALLCTAILCACGVVHFYPLRPAVAAPAKEEAQAVPDKPNINAPGGIVTHGQSGGTNIIINRPAPRSLEDNLKGGLLQIDKAKPVFVLYRNGDPEAQAFGQQIYDYLKQQGYRVQPDGLGWHMFGVQPTDVTITPFNGGTETHVLIETRRL